MARRFETHYRTGHLENIGDPDWHDRRWEDLDRRMHARDLAAEILDVVGDRIERVTLTRLEKISDTIRQAYLLSDNFGLAFRAISLTDQPFDVGLRIFTLTPETRDAYVMTDFVAIRPVGERNLIDGLLARAMNYNPQSGELTVTVVAFSGTGRCAEWDVHAARPFNQAHVQDTDNPHNETLAQLDMILLSGVDTETTTQANAFATTALGTPPANLNTLGKLSDALGGDSSYAENLTTALNNRLLYTGPVAYSVLQKANAAANLDAVAPSYIEGLAKFNPQGRLSLASNTAFHKTSITNATAIWYAPDSGKFWPMWDATLGPFGEFVMRDFSGTGFAISQAMQDATLSPWAAQSYAVYDVFGWMSGSTPRISRGPVWRYTCPFIMTDGHTIRLLVEPGQTHPLRYGDFITIAPSGHSAFWSYYVASGGLNTGFVTQVGNPDNPEIQISKDFNFPPTLGEYPGLNPGILTCNSCLRNVGPGSSELDYPSTLYPHLATNKFAIQNGPPARGGLFLGTIATNASATVDWNYGSDTTACSFMLANAHRKREVASRTGAGLNSWAYAAAGGGQRRAGNRPELEANFVTCDYGDPVKATSTLSMQPSSTASLYSQWLCLDALTVPESYPQPYVPIYRSTGGNGVGFWTLENTFVAKIPSPGRHRLNLLEVTVSGNVTCYGAGYNTYIYYTGQH